MIYITPAEFEDRAKEITKKYQHRDYHEAEIEIAKLMVETLEGNGYGSGIKLLTDFVWEISK